MKKELYLVLKSSDRAFSTLEELKREGFNATVVSTESLRQAVDYYPEEHHFFSLRHLEQKELTQSVLCLFLVDADKIEHLKQIIYYKTTDGHCPYDEWLDSLDDKTKAIIDNRIERLSDEQASRNYDKTINWLEKGIIPSFLKNDMEEYMKNYEQIESQEREYLC